MQKRFPHTHEGGTLSAVYTTALKMEPTQPVMGVGHIGAEAGKGPLSQSEAKDKAFQGRG